MKLHFVRHAEAIDRSPTLIDEYRYLTCRGRTRFRRVAESLKKCGIDPDIIISSPLVRAVQTEEILAETLRFAGELTLIPSLADGFSVSQLHEFLQSIPPTRELMVVGHEPDLGTIVGELLRLSPCTLRKGGVITLKIKPAATDIAANFLWLVTGGGKLITNYDTAINRLAGGHAQSKETSDE